MIKTTFIRASIYVMVCKMTFFKDMSLHLDTMKWKMTSIVYVSEAALFHSTKNIMLKFRVLKNRNREKHLFIEFITKRIITKPLKL